MNRNDDKGLIRQNVAVIPWGHGCISGAYFQQIEMKLDIENAIYGNFYLLKYFHEECVKEWVIYNHLKIDLQLILSRFFKLLVV